MFNLFNFFEMLDDQEKQLKSDARDMILQQTLAKAKNAWPKELHARIDGARSSMRQELAHLQHVRNTTPIRCAVATWMKGGQC